MRLSVGLWVSLVALGRNLLRSALAMVGLIIGVAAVLTMVALGRGARESVTDDMSSAGTNLVFVRAGNYTRGGDAVNIRSGYGKATTLTLEDAVALAEIASVAYLTPEVDDRASITSGISGERKHFAPLVGCGPELASVYELEPIAGRFLEAHDLSGEDNVAVLSRTVRDALFATTEDPLGRMITIGTIGSERVKVIGIVDTSDAAAHQDSVFVPHPFLQRALGIDYLHGIAIAAEQAGDASAIAEEVRALLRERHGLDDPEAAENLPKAKGDFAMTLAAGVPDDFTVQSQASKALTRGLYTTAAAFALASMPRLDEITSEEMVNTLESANRTMTLLLAGIAAVSLVVGGIGIMNIMLLAVTERTMEVGLRMSVGARRRDVLSQFLLEAILLSLAGGLAGIGLGFASAGAVTQFLGWPTYISAQAVALAFGLAFAVGVVFGYYPAMRAARLDPIDALRYE